MKRALLLLPFAFVLLAPASRAAAPEEHGWWTAFAGPNPDVPADGLLVEGGASATSPTAFAAVVYAVPDGSTVGKLTLAVAPSSATVPMTKLELCPLSSATIKAEQGRPMADAPKVDSRNNVTAA